MAAATSVLTKLEPTAEMLRVQEEIRSVESRLPKYGMNLMWLIMFATVIDGFDRSLLSTVLEDVRREFSLSDSDLGFLTGAYSVLATLSVIPFGFLVDRYRRVSILALGFLPWSIGMIGQGLATSFVMLFVFRVMLGALEASNTPSTNSLLGDYYKVIDRQRVFGLQAVANIAGYAAGPIFGGLTAYWWGWRAAFIVWGFIGFITGIIIWRFLPEPPRGLQDAVHRLRSRYQQLRLEQRRVGSGAGVDQKSEIERELESLNADVVPDAASDGIGNEVPMVEPDVARLLESLEVVGPQEEAFLAAAGPAPDHVDYRTLSFTKAVREVLRIRSIWFVYAGVAMTAFSGSLMAVWPATFYRRYHGMSVGGAGLVTGLNALTALVGIMLATKLANYLIKRGLPHYRVGLMAICYAASGTFWTLAFYTSFTPISLHFLAIGSIFATGPNALLLALQTDLVNPYLRGRAAAFTSILRVVGTTAAPVGLGLLADATGLRAALMVVMLPMGLLGAIVMLPALRTYNGDALHQQVESVRQARIEIAEREAAEEAEVTSTTS